jgi:Zn-finger protein
MGSGQNEAGQQHAFYPSLLSVKDGRPVTSSEFESPEQCSGCHMDIYSQWNGSMHSKAFVDPVFQALWKIGSKETDGLVDKYCAGCHTAVGTASEEVAFDEAQDMFTVSEIASRGVQCDFCHTIAGTTYHQTPTGETQNASLIADPGPVKRGPYHDSKSPSHETAYSELHTKSEFCGNCHHVFHPVNNFPIERTYDEWKYSVYAQEGIQCQDCHMMPVEKAIETARTMQKQTNPGKAAIMGPERDNVHTHEFVGANFTLPALLGSEKHSEIATARLQSAADVAILLPDEVKAGELASVKVKVTNVGAGHNLPTSLTEVRQMWLDVQVTDATGQEIYRSGALDDEYNIDPEAVIFNANAVDAEGHHTVKPWEIVRFDSNNTIPPKGSATESILS